MFAPLVLPESLVCTGVADPVGVHVGEEGGLAGGVQDGGDVGVGARRIAVGVEGSVTVVWPGREKIRTRSEREGSRSYHSP